jgi:adenine-specific DNA-methyltransferase
MISIDELKELLQKDTRLIDSEGNLLENRIVELALKLDKDLIKLLLKNERTKNHFFKDIDGILIFDKEKFMKFIDNKESLSDLYTTFKSQSLMTEIAGKSHNPLGPKVFTNFKRINKDGEHEFDGFRRDVGLNKKRKLTENTIIDNLIIKGNNLLALHSLLKEFSEKIKLIYIDPPYNTKNNEFKYKDNFTHSAWLTFMKNRLEVSKELLREDGIIFVQINNTQNSTGESPELGYLLILMDEIFGRTNYITTLVWKKKSNPSNTEKLIGTITESILMYAKNVEKVDLNLLEYKRQYKYSDEKGEYNLEKPIKTNEGTYKRKTMKYTIVEPKTGKKYYPPDGKRWTIGKEKMGKLLQEGKVVFTKNEVYIKKYRKDYLRGDAKLFSNLLDNHGSLRSAKNELQKLGFSREIFDSPKPERLIKTLIDIVVKDKKDIVLDFFLGSGTTCAVAHKMGLQYIGVEQMDYINILTVERMKKVIAGEQGGISKEVGWKGGGDFVYMELINSLKNHI